MTSTPESTPTPESDPRSTLPPRMARALEDARRLHAERIVSPDLRLLEQRVRRALAEPEVAAARTAGRGRGVPLAAAAMLLLAIGAVVFFGGLESNPRDAQAVPVDVLDAARIARDLLDAPAEATPRSCTSADESPLYAFPPVRDNVFVVERCDVDPADAKGTPDPDAHRKARLTARLVRPETLPVVGIVAVPDPDGPRGADIGKTDLGDVLVYDVAYGRTRYYLGVPKREAIRKGDCRMCHHADRLDGRNPHRIVLRRP